MLLKENFSFIRFNKKDKRNSGCFVGTLNKKIILPSNPIREESIVPCSLIEKDRYYIGKILSFPKDKIFLISSGHRFKRPGGATKWGFALVNGHAYVCLVSKCYGGLEPINEYLDGKFIGYEKPTEEEEKVDLEKLSLALRKARENGAFHSESTYEGKEHFFFGDEEKRFFTESDVKASEGEEIVFSLVQG